MTHARLQISHGFRCFAVAAVAGLLQVASAAPAAEKATELFSAPFVVEHHVVQTEPDGTSAATEPVTDYYGGSWLASVRPDGSRLVVDFARRELTEVRPEGSTYTTLSFERYAELRSRLRALSKAAPAASGERGAGREAPAVASREGQAIVVTPLGGDAPRGPGAAATSAAAAPTVVRMRVTAGADAPVIEVWCDRRVLLRERARVELAALETEVLGGGAPRGTAALLAAAREHTGGAFPVRTSRRTGKYEHAPTIEDVATRLEPLDRFPEELLRIPDGYRRVAHPLEVMVAHEEQEAALARGERPRR